MATKDFFSGHAKLYATFRPAYPKELYDFIFNEVSKKHTAWDCATGNGQVAAHLSSYFNNVQATDISQQQLDNAIKADNINYQVSPAEKTFFADNSFDLITVGQALHWFELEKFYSEVNRVGKNKGVLATWGYALCSVNTEIDKLFLDFYHNVVGPYWDIARKTVEDEYRHILFPFEQIPCPRFEIKVTWTLEQFTGYLSTWSATQKYIKTNHNNPVEIISGKLKSLWRDEETKEVTFPVFMKVGRIKK